MWRESDRLKVNKQKILIAGSSAGSNLALATALKARDERGPALAVQLLFYPVIDHRCETPLMKRNAVAPIWTERNCIDMWQQHLANSTLNDRQSYYASPALA